jgi:serine phosphatase RsbU (regulator of sigma subunit)/CheY-like chemotaxis protein/anti-sigma regulatory factor (Ser/Thr protein kinase)
MYPEEKGSRRLAAAVPSRTDAMMPGMDGRDPDRQDGVGDADVRGDPLASEAAAVLIVDDRPENLQALEVFLEPLGNRIATATSGREALRLLDADQFAVILLDVQMPELDGFETAALIRAHAHTRSVPIIFLTGLSASPEHIFRGYEAGAVDYIVKPVDPAILRSKVAVFVELFEKSREIARQSRLLQEQEQERLEREAAEQRHRRSRFAASVAAALERRLDVRGRAGQLAQTCIPELGDVALVQLVEPDGVVEVAAVATRGAQDDLLKRLVGTRSNLSSFGSWVFDDPRARLVEPVTPDTWRDLGLGNEGDLLCARLDLRSLIAAPLALGRRSLGVLVVCAVARDERYGDEELEIAKDVARKAAMAVDNSRLFEAEQERSKALQQSLLGRPEVASTAVAAAWRYLPGTAELEVGGDWYDLIERDDGRILVAVGDVVGHGVQAATAMGKLRSATGALGLVVDSVPELLGRLDQFAEKIEEARFGTVAAVQLQPETGELRYSLAGHPPPLVIDREGEARFLEGGAGLPLCLSLDGANGRPEGRAFLAEGSTLILYTDGLIERRADSIDSGLARLKNAAIARARYEPERLCDEIVDEFAQGSLDDLVFLCLRRETGGSQIFTRVFPAVPKSLHTVRQELRSWLGGQGVEARQIETIVQACGEGCANTVRHAYGEQPGEATLELRLRGNGRLVVRIRDSGRWRTEAHTESSGHGMEIMRALSEHVHIHRTPQGTTVVLEFDVSTGSERAAEAHEQRARATTTTGD